MNFKKSLKLIMKSALDAAKPEGKFVSLPQKPKGKLIVLGAGMSSEGPGPLVTQLVARQGGTLPVPVTIVPGSMTKEAITAVS